MVFQRNFEAVSQMLKHQLYQLFGNTTKRESCASIKGYAQIKKPQKNLKLLKSYLEIINLQL